MPKPSRKARPLPAPSRAAPRDCALAIASRVRIGAASVRGLVAAVGGQPTGLHPSHCCFHLQQERLEAFRPDLVVLLFQEGQLAQVANVAHRMTASGVMAIRLPAIIETLPSRRCAAATPVRTPPSALRQAQRPGGLPHPGHERTHAPTRPEMSSSTRA